MIIVLESTRLRPDFLQKKVIPRNRVSPTPKPCCTHALWDSGWKSAESDQKEAFWGVRPRRQTLTPQTGAAVLGRRRRVPRLNAPPGPAPGGLRRAPQPRLAGRSGPTGPAATGALSPGLRGPLGPGQESAVPLGVARPPRVRPGQPSGAGECPLSPCCGPAPTRRRRPGAAQQTRVERRSPCHARNRQAVLGHACGATGMGRAGRVARAGPPPWTAPPYPSAAARCPPQPPKALGPRAWASLPTFPLPRPAAHPDAGLPDASKGRKEPLTPCGQVPKGLGQLGAL